MSWSWIMPEFTMAKKSLSLYKITVCPLHYSTSYVYVCLLDVRIVFLPPYSPDFNPIEEAFSKIKSFIRREHSYFASSPGLLYPMRLAMDIITPEDAEGYFYHAGYL